MNNLDLELQQLDEARQMRNLVNAVKFADSFSLLFVRCNQRPRQKELIEELKTQLKEYKIKVIFFENEIENLLDELQEGLGDEKPDAIVVYGLENSILGIGDEAKSKFVVTLNHSRNSFKRVLSCPLILFLPEYALSAIYHGATDFYSIRSGIFLFSAKAEETDQQILQHISQTYTDSLGLLFKEKRNRIKTVKDLLAEYQALPDSQRNLEKEYRLKGKLAYLYYTLAEYEESQRLYQELIQYLRDSDDSLLLSEHLTGLGLVYESQGRYKEALELLKEVQHLTRETIGTNHLNYAVTLGNLGLIYEAQGKHNEAINLYNEALKIIRETIGTQHPIYATNLNNLGKVYDAQGRYNKALELIKEALKIDKKTIGTKHPGYSAHLNNLAKVYGAQGNYEKAINLYKEALEIDKEIIGTKHPQYAAHLSNLSRIYYAQGKFKEALALIEESYQIGFTILGENHPYTKNFKAGVKMCQEKLNEQSKSLIPYIK